MDKQWRPSLTDGSATRIGHSFVEAGSAAMLFGLWIAGKLVLGGLGLLLRVPVSRRLLLQRDA